MERVADHALVTIRSGGTASPLFCVHAQSGDVRIYEDLARHLEPPRPVYGVRSVSSGPGERATDQQVRAMSRRYAREIREFKPSGPYVLVGECKGGMVAYELAQQLRSMGEEVSLLALIDAFPPGEPRLQPFVPAPLYRALHRLRTLCLHLCNLAQLDAEARREYVARRARRVSRALAARARRLCGVSSPQHAAEQAFAQATAEYRPAPYSGRAVVFRAARLPWGLESKPDLGWGALVRDLEVEELPAYFSASMSEPRVSRLADALLRHI